MNFFARMLLIMLAINVFLGLINAGIASINPEANYFNITNSTAGTVTSGGLSGSLDVEYEDLETSDAVSDSTDNIFTDTFKTVKDWYNKVENSAGMATAILKQPAGFMKAIGFPPEIYVSFGILWYFLALIAVIMLFRGDG